MANFVVFFHKRKHPKIMQQLQAFKFELQPNGEQERDMRRFAGSCRYVYNKALALQKENYESGGQFIGYVAMAKELTAWRNSKETSWLKESPCHPSIRLQIIFNCMVTFMTKDLAKSSPTNSTFLSRCGTIVPSLKKLSSAS